MTQSSLTAVLRRLCLAIALSPLPGLALAENAFKEPVDFTGRFRVSAEGTGPIFPGGTVELAGSGLQPGQRVHFLRGDQALGDGGVTADDKGAVTFSFTLPEEAAAGIHPVIAVFDNPSAASIVEFKISREIPLSQGALFNVTKSKPTAGLYQSAYSARADALFVTGATFRPVGSELIKADPETLEVIARVTPAPMAGKAVKEGEQPAPVGVLGIGIDDIKGTVWTTNTFENTLAVYAQDDLSLIRQFPGDTVYHARDVKVDAAHGRAYVSSAATDTIHVFDTETLEKADEIRIRSAKRGGDFSLLGLGIDPQGKWLFGVSRVSNELAVIDLASGKLDRIIDLAGAKNASGVDFDPVSGKIYVAAQDSDNLLIVDLASGAVEHNVAVGAGALNVVFEPKSKLAFVSSRGAGQIAVVALDGTLVANLDGGSYANHVSTDGKGTVFAVNKSLGEEDATGDQLLRTAPVE